MARKVKQAGPTRAIAVRVPNAVYADLIAVAQARGQDLSAVVNQVLAEVRPALLHWLSEHQAGLRRPAGLTALLRKSGPRYSASGTRPRRQRPTRRPGSTKASLTRCFG